MSQDLSGAGSDLTIGSMVYNPTGQIVSQVKSNDVYAWTASVNVDRPYTANGLNQYSAAGATSFSYDQRGNLTASGASTYGYNKLNQLVSAPGLTLSYDPAGRLIEMGPGTATRFAYTGGQIVQESNAGGTVLRRYVPGPGVDEPVVWYEGSGTSDRRWLHGDERGSVIAVSDGSGAMLSINRYDEYGIPQAGNVGRFQYTGQAWLPELGMYYYKARIYSPTMGRFMQTDPIGYGDGLNWYDYVGGDPVNASDPSGLAFDCITGSRLCSKHYDGSGGSGAPVSSSRGPSSNERTVGTRYTATTTYPNGTTTTSSVDVYVTMPGSASSGFANPISSAGAGAMPGDIVVNGDSAGLTPRQAFLRARSALSFEVLRKLIITVVPKAVRPKLPKGITEARFGDIAGIPKGQNFPRLPDSHYRSAIDRLKAGGFTIQDMNRWQQFYGDIAFRDLGNDAAAFRSIYFGNLYRIW